MNSTSLLPGIRHISLLIAFGVCATLAPAHLASQVPARATLVNPADVYAACRHPEAERRTGKLRNLCSLFRLPPAGAEFLPSTLRLLDTLSLPKPDEIRTFADLSRGMRDTLPLLDVGRGAVPEILFAYGSATLDQAERQLIARLARPINDYLAANPLAALVIAGLADVTQGATPDSSGSVARQRAAAIQTELARHGVDSSRVQIEAVLVPHPAGTASTAPERQASRGALVRIEAPRLALAPGAFRDTARLPLIKPSIGATPTGLVSPAVAAGGPGGLSASSLAVGMTDVLLERASEQLQVYVVRAVGRRLCGEPPPDASVAYAQARRDSIKAARADAPEAVPVQRRAEQRLAEMHGKHEARTREHATPLSTYTAGYLPQTCALLTQSQQMQYATGISVLRTAFESDMRAMPERMAFQALSNRVIATGVPPRYRQTATTVLVLLHLVQQVENGADPLRVFVQLDADRTARLGEMEFPIPADVRALEQPLVLGLLRFARFASRVDEARAQLRQYWPQTNAVPLDTVLTYGLRALVVSARQTGIPTDAAAQAAEHGAVIVRSPRAAPPSEFQWLLGDSLSGLNSLLSAYRDVEGTVAQARALVQRIEQVQPGTDGWREMQRELYGRAVDLVLGMLPHALMAEPAQLQAIRPYLDPARQIVVSIRAQRYADAMQALMQLMSASGGLLGSDHLYASRFPSFTGEGEVMRALNLAVTLSEARSQDDVNDALRVFVGQASDFLSKREASTRARVALNAYVGAGAGLEMLDPSPGLGGRNGLYMTAFVPIGIEAGWSCGGRFYCGLFIPLVDLGAVAAVRLGGGDVDALPEVGLEQLVTPGAFLVVGIKGTPLSLGGGFVHASNSRQRRGDLPSGAEEHLDALRFGAFLGVDVPLFP